MRAYMSQCPCMQSVFAALVTERLSDRALSEGTVLFMKPQYTGACLHTGQLALPVVDGAGSAPARRQEVGQSPTNPSNNVVFI